MQLVFTKNIFELVFSLKSSDPLLKRASTQELNIWSWVEVFASSFVKCSCFSLPFLFLTEQNIRHMHWITSLNNFSIYILTWPFWKLTFTKVILFFHKSLTLKGYFPSCMKCQWLIFGSTLVFSGSAVNQISATATKYWESMRTWPAWPWIKGKTF